MKKLPFIQLTKTKPLLIGILTGFIFLIALFLGLSISANGVFVVGIFFVAIIVVIMLLLSNSKVHNAK